jgi:hypothetical protein
MMQFQIQLKKAILKNYYNTENMRQYYIVGFEKEKSLTKEVARDIIIETFEHCKRII